MIKAKPFIKWAGGKTQLLPEIRTKYPSTLSKDITKYCEPFVGGGAVLFDILSTFNLKEVLINDINAESINTYIQIKENVSPLISELKDLQTIFWAMDEDARKELYYVKRELFNNLKVNGNNEANLEKAVLFIFLNRTCFNGLFRVNKQGGFNVPMGAYKKPCICDEENLKNAHMLLQNVTIQCGDYKDCFSFIDNKTFVYIDPPYRPLTETASFTSYSESPFTDKEQLELGHFIGKLHKVGAKVVASNSDPKNTNTKDIFFDDLYQAYNIARVSATRMINRNACSRGSISELLISNF